ncbi:permease-like cell division protein FtsX [Nocardioides aurantiacus]|uniref:Cell division protein FtsX n=1 Tax=Nocardioides aurantiacus TaxID=86796 RepID=A0A3N2CVI6_9ACTN|nr:permease-like cell division protein FtsX [Nocardioides aurantiacus]ROR91476.1 cell division protein FtsX [Nocardioides aurantiacus]
MHLRYVFSETRTGLRRNVSMSIALVVTIFVSLTLVGMGLLLNSQADKAERFWGSKLQITVFMCNQNSQVPTCEGEVTPEQKAAIEQVVKTNPEVASYYLQTKAEAFETWKRVYLSQDKSEQEIYSTVTAKDMQESYWVKLKDPNEFQGISQALSDQQGVAAVRDLRQVLKPIYFWMEVMKWGAIAVAGFLLLAAIMQVGNTIRMAAYARRKEIGIMRLVGASRLYISLPFLIETLVAALIGVGLAAGTLLVFMYVVIYGMLRPTSNIVEWVDWQDSFLAIGGVAALGLALTLLPTLVMTRKYLKV